LEDVAREPGMKAGFVRLAILRGLRPPADIGPRSRPALWGFSAAWLAGAFTVQKAGDLRVVVTEKVGWVAGIARHLH
jgi:hypothetical protein